MLKQNHFYPYKIHLHQELFGEDYKLMLNPNFYNKILFPGEATFTLNEVNRYDFLNIGVPKEALQKSSLKTHFRLYF